MGTEVEEVYRRVDAVLEREGIEFNREEGDHKYIIPNLRHLHGRAVLLASSVLRDIPFHATVIPYHQTGRNPEFMVVLHLDDETYTFDPRNL